jgi:hypothetical protein
VLDVLVYVAAAMPQLTSDCSSVRPLLLLLLLLLFS